MNKWHEHYSRIETKDATHHRSVTARFNAQERGQATNGNAKNFSDQNVFRNDKQTQKNSEREKRERGREKGKNQTASREIKTSRDRPVSPRRRRKLRERGVAQEGQRDSFPVKQIQQQRNKKKINPRPVVNVPSPRNHPLVYLATGLVAVAEAWFSRFFASFAATLARRVKTACDFLPTLPPPNCLLVSKLLLKLSFAKEINWERAPESSFFTSVMTNAVAVFL